jgi:hypothetical protein
MPKLDSVFVINCHFQPSIILAGKASSLPLKRSSARGLNRVPVIRKRDEVISRRAYYCTKKTVIKILMIQAVRVNVISFFSSSLTF